MITGPDGDSSMSRLVFNLKEDAGGSITAGEPLFNAAKAGDKTNALLFFRLLHRRVHRCVNLSKNRNCVRM